MAEDAFILLNLKEDKTKKLATALTNKSATKILQYLSTQAQDAQITESMIAKALSLPVSTVNYTMKALIEAKLIISDTFHYSEKGRTINHYRLANKYIIIAPQDAPESMLSQLKNLLPIGLVAAGIGVLAAGADTFFTQSMLTPAAKTMALAPEPMVMRVTSDAAENVLAADALPMAAEISATAMHSAFLPGWLVPFLVGVGVTLLVLLAARTWKTYRSSKK